MFVAFFIILLLILLNGVLLLNLRSLNKERKGYEEIIEIYKSIK